jgi:hypothetical protein
MSNVISKDVDHEVRCDVGGLKIEVKDNAGTIVDLARIQRGKPSDVKEDQYSLGYTCTYPYSVT